MARRPAHRFHVYVIELADSVWQEHAFRKANPDFLFARPLVYVGMTGLDPDRRFDRHKAGIQANRYVRDHGLRLLPELYAVYNPMPYEGAREMEVELAVGLREAGYAVWQA
jgi:hypothetical protein